LLDGVERRCGEEDGRSEALAEKMNVVDIVTQTDQGGLFLSPPLSSVMPPVGRQ
jgi:hypothetical protein